MLIKVWLYLGLSLHSGLLDRAEMDLFYRSDDVLLEH